MWYNKRCGLFIILNYKNADLNSVDIDNLSFQFTWLSQAIAPQKLYSPFPCIQSISKKDNWMSNKTFLLKMILIHWNEYEQQSEIRILKRICWSQNKMWIRQITRVLFWELISPCSNFIENRNSLKTLIFLRVIMVNSIEILSVEG